jgi:integrase
MWQDLDFERASIQVTRGIVNGRVGEAKTEYSQDLLPMDPGLANALLAWRKEASPSPDNWVFPNPKTLRPYYACSIEKRHLQRIAKKLGIQCGWHTFRHTYRSWLDATGATIGEQQKLMRHASVFTTMNTYGNALMDSKRAANSKVVRMALDGKRES